MLDLLVAMGYGGSRKEAAAVTQKTGDEGIDGVTNEDRLGLDVIYLQAKRWKANVGRPEIQNFVGALAGKKASKGVFITTSAFHENARDYAAAHSPESHPDRWKPAGGVDDRTRHWRSRKSTLTTSRRSTATSSKRLDSATARCAARLTLAGV